MALESACVVHKVKKSRTNILIIRISVYEFSPVKDSFISSGIEILQPCLEYVPLYA